MSKDRRPGEPLDIHDGHPFGIHPDNPLGYPSGDIDIEPAADNFGKRNYDRHHSFYDQAYDYGIDGGRWKRSFARILHLLPNASPIDVYLDGRLFCSSLYFKALSDYTSVRPGNHRILFYPLGQRSRPVFIKTLYIPKKSMVSLAIYGTSSQPDVMVLDDKTVIPSGLVKIKFVHLSPQIPAVDLLADGSPWFSQVFYQEATEYIPVASGRESLSLRISGTRHIIFTLPNAHFYRNKAYTIYAIGLTHASPYLTLMITQDDTGKYIT